MNLDELEGQARADGWLDGEGFWAGPPDHAELLAHAIKVFGSSELAEAWMSDPAMSLNWQRPADIVETPAGCQAISVALARIASGVYC